MAPIQLCASTVAGDGSARNKNTAANFLKMRYTGVWLLFECVADLGTAGQKHKLRFF